MARHAKTFQTRMATARKEAGLSYVEAAYAIRPYLAPSQHVSYGTIRRVEHIDERNADPILVWALAQAYGVSLEELSPMAAEWFAKKLRPTVLGKHRSDWSGVSAGHHAA